MPEIEVFLIFSPTDRSRRADAKGAMVLESGPNWQALAVEASRSGYTLTVHGPSIHPTVAEIDHSMKNAAVTLFVGHGSGATDTSGAIPKWVSNQIKLADGVISSPNGMYQGQWQEGTLTSATKPAKVGLPNVTGIFTCNSYTKLPDAFAQTPGSHLITNDGGADGFTRVGTLETGAAEFVKEYVHSKGNVASSMAKAQALFVAKGLKSTTDKGDKLHDKPGPPPPRPPVPFSDELSGVGGTNGTR